MPSLYSRPQYIEILPPMQYFGLIRIFENISNKRWHIASIKTDGVLVIQKYRPKSWSVVSYTGNYADLSDLIALTRATLADKLSGSRLYTD